MCLSDTNVNRFVQAWHADAIGSVQPSPARSSRSVSEKASSVPSRQPATSVPAPPPVQAVSPSVTQESPRFVQFVLTAGILYCFLYCFSRNLPEEHNEVDEFDEEQEPIGTCVALYDFEGLLFNFDTLLLK